MPDTLWNIFKWLLDFEAPAIRSISGARIHYTGGGLLLAALGAALAVGVGLTVASYVRPMQYLPNRSRALLGLLRASGYICLALGISGMTLVLDLQVREKPATLVLVDDSLSMNLELATGGGEAAPARRIDRVKQLLAGDFLTDLRAKRRIALRRLSDPADAGFAGGDFDLAAKRTDLPAAVNVAVEEARHTDLREILLLTDGTSTVNPDYLATRARLAGRGVKLFPVLVDERTDFDDVRISSVRTAPYARAFDHISVWFELGHRGYAGETTRIEIVDPARPDDVLESREVTFENGKAARGVFRLPPLGRDGRIELALRAAPLAGERVLRNNEASVVVHVIDEPIKVLYIDNFPRPEFVHTKWSIDRDPNIALTAMNRMPGGGWRVQGSNVLLENPGGGFPEDAGELLKHDVLILGSISRGYFSRGDARYEGKLTNIARFVSGRGGGLVVMGGHRSYGQGRYRGSPLDPLMPFDLPTYAEARFMTERFQAELTELGAYHPIVQLGDAQRSTAEAWEALPELDGVNLVGELRPGSQVLAVAGEEVAGRKPIFLATRQYGYGRVVASTAYSMFQWRLGSPVEEGHDPLKRFWRQTVRYVAPDPRLAGGALNLDFGSGRRVVGETIEVVCRPLDANYDPVQGRQIHVTINDPEGQTVTTMLLADSRSERGVYRGRFRPERPGIYRVIATDPQEEAFDTDTEIAVGESGEEFRHIGQVDRGLAEAADRSGGRLVSWSGAASLPAEIPEAPQEEAMPVSVPLWSSPLLLILLVALLAAEWYLRKRNALA